MGERIGRIWQIETDFFLALVPNSSPIEKNPF
jgi:hypothetical protein